MASPALPAAAEAGEAAAIANQHCHSWRRLTRQLQSDSIMGSILLPELIQIVAQYMAKPEWVLTKQVLDPYDGLYISPDLHTYTRTGRGGEWMYLLSQSLPCVESEAWFEIIMTPTTVPPQTDPVIHSFLLLHDTRQPASASAIQLSFGVSRADLQGVPPLAPAQFGYYYGVMDDGSIVDTQRSPGNESTRFGAGDLVRMTIDIPNDAVTVTVFPDAASTGSGSTRAKPVATKKRAVWSRKLFVPQLAYCNACIACRGPECILRLVEGFTDEQLKHKPIQFFPT